MPPNSPRVLKVLLSFLTVSTRLTVAINLDFENQFLQFKVIFDLAHLFGILAGPASRIMLPIGVDGADSSIEFEFELGLARLSRTPDMIAIPIVPQPSTHKVYGI